MDIILITYFQSRALIPEIFEYVNFDIPYSFCLYGFLLLLLLLLIIGISFYFSKFFSFNKKDVFCLLIIFLLYIVFHFVYGYKFKFLGNILTLNPIYRIANGGFVQPKCDTNYTDNLDIVEGKGKKLNIILLVLESYSAIDSFNAGGYNHLSLFDEIQNDGVIFKNVIENGGNSASSHESLLYGVIPGRKSDYKSFGHVMQPIPNFLNDLGYNTILISTSDLYFMDQISFFKESGFKTIIGSDSFNDYEHYTFSSAPDEYLYNKALDEINLQTGNYFMFLKNISFHKPYNTPYGDTQELALKYSEDKLYEFYNGLKNINFFDNGLLILIGDHRMMNPAQPGEIDRMGDSWSLRTVATVVGSGISSGEINNSIIQHTDIYNSLKVLLGSGDVQIDKYYNNVFSNENNRNWSITVKGGSSSSKNRYDIFSISSGFISLETDELYKLDYNLYEYICSSLELHDGELGNILEIHRK